MRHEQISVYVEELYEEPTLDNLRRLAGDAAMTPQALLQLINEVRPDFRERIGTSLSISMENAIQHHAQGDAIPQKKRMGRIPGTGRAQRILSERSAEIEMDIRNRMQIADMAVKYGVSTASIVRIRKTLRDKTSKYPEERGENRAFSSESEAIIAEIGEMDSTEEEKNFGKNQAISGDPWSVELDRFIRARDRKPKEILVLQDLNKTTVRVTFEKYGYSEIFEYQRIIKEA